MKEAYVSYEVAKLLKDKEFDWDCEHYYKPNGEIVRTFHTDGSRHINSSVLYENQCLAPTQQMAMRWLRERGIHIMPTIGCDVDRTPRIFYGAVIALFNDYGDIDYRDPLDENGYDKSEDAVEAALKYCLTNLI